MLINSSSNVHISGILKGRYMISRRPAHLDKCGQRIDSLFDNFSVYKYGKQTDLSRAIHVLVQSCVYRWNHVYILSTVYIKHLAMTCSHRYIAKYRYSMLYILAVRPRVYYIFSLDCLMVRWLTCLHIWPIAGINCCQISDIKKNKINSLCINYRG